MNIGYSPWIESAPLLSDPPRKEGIRIDALEQVRDKLLECELLKNIIGETGGIWIDQADVEDRPICILRVTHSFSLQKLCFIGFYIQVNFVFEPLDREIMDRCMFECYRLLSRTEISISNTTFTPTLETFFTLDGIVCRDAVHGIVQFCFSEDADQRFDGSDVFKGD